MSDRLLADGRRPTVIALMSVIAIASYNNLSAAAALRDSGDDLTKRTTESFIESLKLLRTKAQTADANFIRAREQYFEM